VRPITNHQKKPPFTIRSPIGNDPIPDDWRTGAVIEFALEHLQLAPKSPSSNCPASFQRLGNQNSGEKGTRKKMCFVRGRKDTRLQGVGAERRKGHCLLQGIWGKNRTNRWHMRTSVLAGKRPRLFGDPNQARDLGFGKHGNQFKTTNPAESHRRKRTAGHTRIKQRRGGPRGRHPSRKPTTAKNNLRIPTTTYCGQEGFKERSLRSSKKNAGGVRVGGGHEGDTTGKFKISRAETSHTLCTWLKHSN